MNSTWRRGALTVIAAVTLIGNAGAQGTARIDVFKTPTCGCCAKWVEHLRAAGFTPKVTDVSNLSAIKTQRAVPVAVQSCHTAVIGGYVIEGHVPAADIKRLLARRPAVAGLAVAGMPIGSPGMEGPNPDRYDVVTFDKQGRTTVFATHGR